MSDKNKLTEDEPLVSNHLWLALIVYPIILSVVSLVLIRLMGAKGPADPMAMVSLFVFIASIFSLIPAVVTFVICLPASMLQKDNFRVERSKALVKITSIFIVVDSVLFFLSLYVF